MAISAAIEGIRMSVHEYLAAERIASEKHEFLDGIVRAMPDARPRHAVTTPKISYLVQKGLEGRDCIYLDQDVRIKIPGKNTYTYPDGAIACPPEFATDDTMANLLNPLVVFEVLSPSTEAYDRGLKFQNYISILSLEEYVVVSTIAPIVEVFRAPDWRAETYEGLDAYMELRSVGISIPLNELYRDTFRLPLS